MGGVGKLGMNHIGYKEHITDHDNF